MPSASIVSAAIMHISASAAGVGAPTVSASNCMNWRKRPGPGFSLRNTQPKRYERYGLASVSKFSAT